ncbi:MAG: putative quinol monooxygenase [Ferruginibacter sp.]
MQIKKTGLPFFVKGPFRKIYTSSTSIISINRGLWLILSVWTPTLLFSSNATAQEKSQMVRLAKLRIDSAQLESYKALLKEEIEASVRIEPGVITLYAVSEKDVPTHITILEIYADTVAYKAHLQTPHFIKYKTAVKEMVRSLELVEAIPLVPGMKIR